MNLIACSLSPARLALLLGLILSAALKATAPEQPVFKSRDQLAHDLNASYLRGECGGLDGIYYENRDGGHSALNLTLWPQLKALPAAAQIGPARDVRALSVLGNCSMAAEPLKGGCLPRFYMMDPLGMRFLAAQHQANNLFIYPAHFDYRHGPLGDLLPANTPCTLLSLGSSGSDQPLLEALLIAAAALPRESRRTLETRGLLAPVLGWLLRQNLQTQASSAWPSPETCTQVIAGERINRRSLMQQALGLQPDRLPPIAKIRVQSESAAPIPGRDFFDRALGGHALADTPFCVARVFRARHDFYDLELDLSQSIGWNQRPLEWQVRCVNGPAASLKQLPSKDPKRLKLRLFWSQPWLDAQQVLSSRLDVAIAADDGLGPPGPAAMISLWMDPNEWRLHDEQGRLIEIDHQSAHRWAGLPSIEAPEAWLKLLFAAAQSQQPRHLRHRLLGRVLNPAQAQAIGELLQPLEALRRAIAAEPRADREGGEARRQQLQQDLQAALNRPIPPRGISLRRTLNEAIDALATDAQWLPEHLDEIRQLALESGGGARLDEERKRLQDSGWLKAEANPPWQPQSLENDGGLDENRLLHAIEALNRCALAHAVFAGILERAELGAWVDPRLAARQAWRDVLQRDSSGQITGWTRHEAGQRHSFDSTGRLRQPDGQTQNVRYFKDSQGWLRWQPQP